MPEEYQTGGLASNSREDLGVQIPGFRPYYNYIQPTQEEMDQQEADYYGITVDELRNYRQQQLGITASNGSGWSKPVCFWGYTNRNHSRCYHSAITIWLRRRRRFYTWRYEGGRKNFF